MAKIIYYENSIRCGIYHVLKVADVELAESMARDAMELMEAGKTVFVAVEVYDGADRLIVKYEKGQKYV